MISVIIPVYNVENYLHKCINSVLAQTYKNIEVLLINDGSTDNSPMICEQFAKENKKVKVFHKENGGVSSARNLGLKKAMGDYIGFVDADDWIEPEMYEQMRGKLIQENAQICIISNYVRGNKKFSNCNIVENSISREEGVKAILDYNFPSSLWTSLYKSNILNNLYLNEKIHHLEDFEFQIRAINNSTKIAISNSFFYNYRDREGSANNSGFNSKVLTCLEIIPIVDKIIKNNSHIKNIYVNAVRSRMTLVVSSFMARTNYKDRNLEKRMTTNARIAVVDTLFTNIPIKKKILVFLLSISFNLYASFYRLIK